MGFNPNKKKYYGNVYVSIGSNINREHHVTESLKALTDRFAPLHSNFYDCEPVGFNEDNFLNLVVGFECNLPVAELTGFYIKSEQNDREASDRAYASRTMDIDILLGNQVGIIDGVELPRGEITEYAFVLRPLVDVAAQEHHPTGASRFNSSPESFDQLGQKTEPIPFELSFT
ncbi:2-amino-4-hydroxy-6-hydroxymethyldihydropteridine diphosphokinase [Vibrio lentus]|nr:2-amino-4-hydroxy-6-hydroxymethyldihydropteridine diphosphokinase [Vibrio lentus]